MRFQFDHFVHLVNSPKKAMETYRDLQLHAVEGGRHENYGTFNSLSYFGLSYIELVGVFDKFLLARAAEPHSFGRSILANNLKESGVRIALRSHDLLAEAERFRKLGFEVVGPKDYSRKRPDGSITS